MKLTKSTSKEFFNLIKNENEDTHNQCCELLKQFPELANKVVGGMSKGIDGYSPLTLAVRFFKFDFARELIEAGSDVNFIDTSPFRKNYYPVFLDLIAMMKDVIEWEYYWHMPKALDLWDTMESRDLDYSKKSVTTDGVNLPENCIESFIRIAGVGYQNKHKVHNETRYDPPNPYVNIFRLSEESRNPEKEKWYRVIAEKLVAAVDESLVQEIDANRGRSWSSAILPFYIEFGYVDSFALEVINEEVKKKYGYELKNMNDAGSLAMRIHTGITRFVR